MYTYRRTTINNPIHMWTTAEGSMLQRIFGAERDCRLLRLDLLETLCSGLRGVWLSVWA